MPLRDADLHQVIGALLVRNLKNLPRLEAPLGGAEARGRNHRNHVTSEKKGAGEAAPFTVLTPYRVPFTNARAR